MPDANSKSFANWNWAWRKSVAIKWLWKRKSTKCLPTKTRWSFYRMKLPNYRFVLMHRWHPCRHIHWPFYRFQINQDKANNETQQLVEENESLRNRLRDVVHSPLSDAEKQQIIDDSQRLHSSAPASIALPNVSFGDDFTQIGRFNWIRGLSDWDESNPTG